MSGASRATALCLVPLAVSVAIVSGGGAQDGQPPRGFPPVLRHIQLVFPTQHNVALRSRDDYLKMMGLPRRHHLGAGPRWIPYTRVESAIFDDAQRLWRSGLLHSLWVDVVDNPFDNGVVGKRVLFNLVERAQAGAPPTRFPEPAPGYETPSPPHERIYPPIVRR